MTPPPLNSRPPAPPDSQVDLGCIGEGEPRYWVFVIVLVGLITLFLFLTALFLTLGFDSGGGSAGNRPGSENADGQAQSAKSKSHNVAENEEGYSSKSSKRKTDNKSNPTENEKQEQASVADTSHEKNSSKSNPQASSTSEKNSGTHSSTRDAAGIRNQNAANSGGTLVPIGNFSGGTTFFGVKSKSGPVSFVIDHSGSMADDRRFDKTRRQLIQSIASMGPHQKFNVFVYNSVTTAFKEGRLVEATNATKSEFGQWIAKISPRGSTNPLPAFEMAANSSTKTIFILSDGQFNGADRIIQLSKKHNLIVHTFSLSRNDSTMKSIAGACGGQFTLIQ